MAGKMARTKYRCLVWKTAILEGMKSERENKERKPWKQLCEQSKMSTVEQILRLRIKAEARK
jgi:hypothetical protein